MKFPSTSTGGTLPSGSSLAGTDPAPCGSRVDDVGRAAVATAGWMPAVKLNSKVTCNNLVFIDFSGLGDSSGVGDASYYNTRRSLRLLLPFRTLVDEVRARQTPPNGPVRQLSASGAGPCTGFRLVSRISSTCKGLPPGQDRRCAGTRQPQSTRQWSLPCVGPAR